MALSCYWPNKFITVPKSDLTLIEGTRYKITVAYWWQLLRELMETEEGIPFDTSYRSTAATAGTPQIVELINGYTAEFENGLYSVELTDGNTNWREIEVKNQVSVGTNNTAAFIDPVFLEASLFTEGVILDIINGTPGTGKDSTGGIIGTRQVPSNNIEDAHIIAQFRGTRNIVIINSMTIANQDMSDGHTFIGNSPYVLLTVDPTADLTNCAFEGVSFQGEVDGMNSARDCFVLDITAASGSFYNCAFGGNITLNGRVDMFDCYSRVEGGGYPTFTVGTHNVVVRQHRGSFGLVGASVGHLSSVGVQGGRLVIDASCAGGEVHARGEPFEIIDNSGAACTVFREVEGESTREMWDLAGLNKDKPMTVTPTSRTVKDITLAISGDGTTNTTVTRQ